jgi:hypothetical protein
LFGLYRNVEEYIHDWPWRSSACFEIGPALGRPLCERNLKNRGIYVADTQSVSLQAVCLLDRMLALKCKVVDGALECEWLESFLRESWHASHAATDGQD